MGSTARQQSGYPTGYRTRAAREYRGSVQSSERRAIPLPSRQQARQALKPYIPPVYKMKPWDVAPKLAIFGLVGGPYGLAAGLALEYAINLAWRLYWYRPAGDTGNMFDMSGWEHYDACPANGTIFDMLGSCGTNGYFLADWIADHRGKTSHAGAYEVVHFGQIQEPVGGTYEIINQGQFLRSWDLHLDQRWRGNVAVPMPYKIGKIEIISDPWELPILEPSAMPEPLPYREIPRRLNNPNRQVGNALPLQIGKIELPGPTLSVDVYPGNDWAFHRDDAPKYEPRKPGPRYTMHN